ncbi:hypothetical protein EL79_5129 [Escherichia coli]|nr:hypothetical protein EL79_5129 [Escherichia coli]
MPFRTEVGYPSPEKHETHFCHAKEKPRYQQIPGFSFMSTDNPVGKNR